MSFLRKLEAQLDAARLAEKIRELDNEINFEESRRVGKETRSYARIVDLTRERALLRIKASEARHTPDEARLRAVAQDIAAAMSRYKVERDVRGYDNVFGDFIDRNFSIIH